MIIEKKKKKQQVIKIENMFYYPKQTFKNNKNKQNENPIFSSVISVSVSVKNFQRNLYYETYY